MLSEQSLHSLNALIVNYVDSHRTPWPGGKCTGTKTDQAFYLFIHQLSEPELNVEFDTLYAHMCELSGVDVDNPQDARHQNLKLIAKRIYDFVQYRLFTRA